MKKKKIDGDKVFGAVNILLLLLIMVVMLYPLYFTIIASVSEPVDVVSGKVIFFPKGFTLASYKQAFKESRIWVGYRNSIVYTACGTTFSMMLTIPAAYAMSKKRMHLRSVINLYFVIPMFIGGGLLPFYLLMKRLDLINKPYTLIILSGFSIYNMIVARTYFTTSIPESLYEAAEIDGCSEFGRFFKIALPLAKPIIAVIALYYAVGNWNSYFNALLYVSEKSYYPLQTVLRNILLENQISLLDMDISIMTDEQIAIQVKQQYMAETMKYAIIFIASFPMLVAYPFVQKYFVKGVMIGSVKG